MSFETIILQQRINDLERQINHIRSVMLNVMAEIRIAAEEEDYDEIISICDEWEPK